jgi:Cytochrome oxidase complex assembly protein 1
MSSGGFSGGFSTPPFNSSSSSSADQWNAPPPGATQQAKTLKWVAYGCLTFILLFIVMSVSVVGLAWSALRNSDVVKIAVEQASHSPEVAASLGTPLKTGWFISGSLSTSGADGKASLTVPVSGPLANGTLYIVGHKTAGRWELDQLDAELPSHVDRVDVRPAGKEQ